jgi:hypothetical protein
MELSPTSLENSLAEPVLKFTDLHGNGGLRQI